MSRAGSPISGIARRSRRRWRWDRSSARIRLPSARRSRPVAASSSPTSAPRLYRRNGCKRPKANRAPSWPREGSPMRAVALASLLSTAAVGVPLSAAEPTDGGIADWTYYGGDPGGSRYSPLTQINRSNVQELKVAWVYHTGDVSDGTKHPRKSAFETTPIMVDGTLYFSTAFNRVIALDPETGAERWSYDPKIDLDGRYSEGLINRGVSSWADGRPGSLYKRRIFIATIDARLICLDAASGKPCTDFGAAGEVNLRQGIQNIIREGEYEETSPPAIIDDLVIVGSSIADNDRVESPTGVVRALDARTGALRWTWNPIPQDPRDPAAETWQGESRLKTGAANAWSVIVTDVAGNGK